MRSDRKHWNLVKEEAHTGAATSFQAYECPLASVSPIKYLERVLTELENNWPAVFMNLMKAWMKWDKMLRILVWEGVDARTSSTLYKAVVQAVILFGSKMWVMTT